MTQLWFITGSNVNASVPLSPHSSNSQVVYVTKYFKGFTLSSEKRVYEDVFGLYAKYQSYDVDYPIAYREFTLNIPALNYTFGSSNTVQPTSIQQLILIKI